MLSESLLEILDQGQHLFLGRLREILLHIHLSDSFSKHAVRNRHGPLPARLLLGDSRHAGAEEVERSLVEIIAQGVAAILDELSGDIILQDLEVGAGEQGAELLEEIGLGHDELLLCRDSPCIKVSLPSEARELFFELAGRIYIVLGFDIPFLHTCPGIQSECILDCESIR